jgi:hypothetical protein
VDNNKAILQKALDNARIMMYNRCSGLISSKRAQHWIPLCEIDDEDVEIIEVERLREIESESSFGEGVTCADQCLRRDTLIRSSPLVRFEPRYDLMFIR